MFDWYGHNLPLSGDNLKYGDRYPLIADKAFKKSMNGHAK